MDALLTEVILQECCKLQFRRLQRKSGLSAKQFSVPWSYLKDYINCSEGRVNIDRMGKTSALSATPEIGLQKCAIEMQ
ncbi:MAG: hypothetical protein LBN19_01165 [Endomicrobium sp.]|jgi:hypothetical protein|nr:hypothetical protein [Endomicrobium sp.]